jgi:two-component system, chemotaxis family, chemotaxis protein CheY
VKKVLVVDDSETIREQVATALTGAGFEVIEAANGLDGLACAAENEIDLMLLDVNMPKLTGLEVLERLAASAAKPGFPIIMLTTEAHRAMIEKAKRLGARAWIVKPVKMNLLVAAVNQMTSAR